MRASGHQVVGVDLDEPPACASVSTTSSTPTSTRACPEAGRASSTWSSPATSSSTSSTRRRCCASCATASAPAARSWSSIPNFGHWYPRARVAVGRFDYDQRGPLDHGHLRFFTRRSFERLRIVCGLLISERDVVGSPVDVLDRGGETYVSKAARGAARVDRAATAAWPTMFGYQFLYRLEAI